jgi:hypothetical protein
MARRRSATVTEIDRREWIAVVGGVEHVYKTRAGAVARLVDEVEHWVRWARSYDHASIEPLTNVRDSIAAANGPMSFDFTVAGLPAHCELRRP